jgi:hypothetical protein
MISFLVGLVFGFVAGAIAGPMGIAAWISRHLE